MTILHRAYKFLAKKCGRRYPPRARYQNTRAQEVVSKSNKNGCDLEQTKSAEDEGTLTSDITRCLHNKNMLDFVLVGSDETKVPAARLIIAARSKVLEKMLYGSFKEASSNEIRLNYSGQILDSVVRFCYSNSLAHLPRNEHSARNLLQLLECAHYLEILPLEAEVLDFTKGLLADCCQLACALFDESAKIPNPPPHMRPLTLNAMSCIRQRTRRTLLPVDQSRGGGITCLSSFALKKIMLDTRIEAEELTMLLALKKWADVHGGCGGSAQLVKECVAFIDVNKIRPSDLIGFVSSCGLVESSRVSAALQRHALKAEEGGRIKNSHRFEKIRTPRVLVEGAGVEGVNGMYHEDGVYDGVSMFSRTTEWEGQATKFVILRWAGSSWYISRLPEDEVIGSSENDFYSISVDGTPHPPSATFRNICRLGLEPPPSCRFIPIDPSE